MNVVRSTPELVDNSVAACLTYHELLVEKEDPTQYLAEVNVNLKQTHQCPPGLYAYLICNNSYDL